MSVGRTLCRRSDAAAAVTPSARAANVCQCSTSAPFGASVALAEPSRSTIRRRWGSGVSAARSMPTVSVPRKPTVVTSVAAFEADSTYAASSPLKRVLMGTTAAPGGLRAQGGDDPAQTVGRPDRDAIARAPRRRPSWPGSRCSRARRARRTSRAVQARRRPRRRAAPRCSPSRPTGSSRRGRRIDVLWSWEALVAAEALASSPHIRKP